MDLDTVDWKLIHQLQRNGRASFKELGDSIGFTGLGAKKRVEKLLNQKIIQISPLINVEKLDMRLALIQLEMEDAKATRRIIDQYKKCPRILHFFTTLGGYNLIAIMIAEDQNILECESMEDCSLRSGEGIRRSEYYPIGKVHHSPFLMLRLHDPKQKGITTPCDTDCGTCPSFQTKKCIGCPSTSYYQGPLR